MKKLFLTLTICALGGVLMAQQGLKVGAFVMPQASYLFNSQDIDLGDDLHRIELLGGMAGGVMVGYNFNDIVGVRANVIYSSEGGRYSTRRDISTRNNYTTRLEYLKIPLMVGGNTSTLNRKVVFSLYGGVQLDFLTRANRYNDNPAFEAPAPENVNNIPSTSETMAAFNYSAVGDVGVDIYLTPDAVLNLHIRGDYGLADSENKDASLKVREGGVTSDVKFWDYTRGAAAIAETHSLNVGLLIGVTYTLGQ